MLCCGGQPVANSDRLQFNSADLGDKPSNSQLAVGGDCSVCPAHLYVQSRRYYPASVKPSNSQLAVGGDCSSDLHTVLRVISTGVDLLSLR